MACKLEGRWLTLPRRRDRNQTARLRWNRSVSLSGPPPARRIKPFAAPVCTQNTSFVVKTVQVPLLHLKYLDERDVGNEVPYNIDTV